MQKVTVYSTGIAKKSANPDAARDFVGFLTSPAVRPQFATAGLDYRE